MDHLFWIRNVGRAGRCNCFVRVLTSRLLWKDGDPSLATLQHDSVTEVWQGRYARIGVMLRYGDTSSVQWFYIDQAAYFTYSSAFGTVMRSLTLVFPCPDWGMNKFNWFSKGFNSREPVDTNANKHGGYLFTCAYGWRLNMEFGKFKSRILWALNSLWTSLS